jgi:SAM-dependent methyltransferase
MTENKHHWYDGWFYDKIIAPNQDRLFGHIKDLIENDSDVIDIGCGTGRLAFTTKDKYKSLLGIDLSQNNIKRAQQILARQPDNKISFRHINLTDLLKDGKVHFDYAVLSYVIHEVKETERIKLLNEIAMVADYIIIGDYMAPKPDGFGGFISEVIEFMAGRDHYRNYKSFVANGGIYYLAKKAGLKIKNELTLHSNNNHIVLLIR